MEELPTRVFRALLGVFFDPTVLAQSSALGSKFNNGLDRTILEACIGNTYTIQFNALININCYNYMQVISKRSFKILGRL